VKIKFETNTYMFVRYALFRQRRSHLECELLSDCLYWPYRPRDYANA